MAKSLTQLADEIYKEALSDGEPVTKEEALDMAKMELGAKTIKNYVSSTVEKKKTPRKRKIDREKLQILQKVQILLEGMGAEIAELKTETEIKFKFSDSSYTLKLTKHRPKKK